ncbi:hypothetical protein Tco_1000807 [Tanacetum coccineum]
MSLQGKHKFTYIEDSDEEEGDGDALEYKHHEFTLQEEDIDEEEGNMQNYIYPNTWSNINDKDENGIDLYDSDMYNIRSVSDEDEHDSFINDGTTNYATTDDEDSGHFF